MHITKCPYCSETVPDKAVACPACAEPLEITNIEPATPTCAQHESQPSTIPKRSKIKLVCLLILAVGVLAYCVHFAAKYSDFTNQLTAVNGLRIGDSRDEVKYRLGLPPEVLGPLETDDPQFRGFQRIYTVSAPTNDVNSMPPATKVDDYDEWAYDEASRNVRLNIEFNKAGFVKSFEFYSNSEKSYGWTRIVGIGFADSEEVVLRLGAPTKQTLDGVTKTMEYADIGLKVTLTKGKAYRVQIAGLPQGHSNVLWRFLRAYFAGLTAK